MTSPARKSNTTDNDGDTRRDKKTPLVGTVAAGGQDEAQDRVAVVRWNPDGTPAQTKNFKLLIAKDASDDEKAAAWNKGDGSLPDEAHVEYI